MISISVKKKYEVQYEQPVKITETNEPQGVNKSFVQVSLLKWPLPSKVLLICYQHRELVLYSPQ